LATAPRILILNGPNLNQLGRRQPEIYGSGTLDELRAACEERAAMLGLAVDFRQSNSEATLIDWVQEARDTHRAIIINPAGLTHSSVALLDALLFSELPVIEVHLTNIFKRESFRSHSYVSLAALGVISGLGRRGYLAALDALADQLTGGDDG
jgi:3-dehydroquinate dehydratase II